ncbi:MAG: Mu transposase C-terminal domain-containing protein [Myxococcales bacterium]|nr:Mu transposase C-terminal domain-containing protein [Myxococcales bacterium]
MDDDDRQRVALWRFGVLGPLVSARLEHGDRRAWFRAAAERVHEHPGGRLVRLSARTIESWYLAYRKGGLRALEPEARIDCGRSRAIRAEVAELLLRAKREKPRRSIRRLIRMLERAGAVCAGELSRSSVHRLLAGHGISARPTRGPATERRSFITEHAGDLCIGDALHGPQVLTPDGRPKKAILFSELDCSTRYIIESRFVIAPGERPEDHERGLKNALLKAGLFRCYYVDRGAPYTAGSLRSITADLGIRLLYTGSGDAEAKGAIERWHRTWREEVGDELGDRILTLPELNALHWAWLEQEYHAREHDTTGRAPREHWLAEVAAGHVRPLPRGIDLDAVFLHRAIRHVRKDGTLSFRGQLLEVRAELSGQRVELRFDPHDPLALPKVYVAKRFFCDTVPLDRRGNATRRRRRDLGAAEPHAEPSGLDPLALIARDHYARTRGTPPPDDAFRHLLDDDEDPEDNDHDNKEK